MILQPISAYPNDGIDIDASLKNIFFTIIQGSSSIVVGYKLDIYNFQNYSLVYTSNKINLTKNLNAGEQLNMEVPSTSGMINGSNYYWTVRLFQSVPDIFITDSVVQTGSTTSSIIIRQHSSIKVGMYLKIQNQVKKITSYTFNSNDTATAVVETPFTFSPTANTRISIVSDFVDSIQFPFSARKTPSLWFRIVPQFISNRSYLFQLEYSQENGVPIKWYKIQIKDEFKNIIYDTGNIYSSALSYEFDLFESGKKYIGQGFCENIDGIFVQTIEYTFSVEYPLLNLLISPKVECVPEDSAIKISWFDDLYSQGIATGKYHFEKDFPEQGETSLVIDSGTIYYDMIGGEPLNLDGEFGVFTDISFDGSKSGKIIELSGNNGESYYIEINSNDMNYVKNGQVTFIRKILEFVLSGQQPVFNPQPGTNYIWMDEENWNDTYYWTEAISFTQRYKILILKDEVIVTPVLPDEEVEP